MDDNDYSLRLYICDCSILTKQDSDTYLRKFIHLWVLCPDEGLQWRILHLFVCEFSVVINDYNTDSYVCIYLSSVT
jgi:hypothetical protein